MRREFWQAMRSFRSWRLGVCSLGLSLLWGAGCLEVRDAESSEKDDSNASESSNPSPEDAEESSQEEEEEEEEESEGEGSPELSPLPTPTECETFAPDIAFPDTNPSSDSFKKKLSPKDYKGRVSLWIPTFDCDC